MQKTSTPVNRILRAGMVLSLLAHLAGALLLLLVPVSTLPKPSPETSVSVELVAQPKPAETIDAAPARKEIQPLVARQSPDTVEDHPPAVAATPDAGLADVERTQPRPVSKVPAMIRASRLLSAGVLADPRSRQAREALATLSPDERVIQLCDMEALEQVHAWKAALRPDMVVAYAMADPTLTDGRLDAPGAAFRNRRHWYAIAFTCAVTPDLAKVASFEFLVGDEIPRKQWQEHNLSASDGGTD